MRHDADVVVIGLGVMGAATLAALARRGVRAVGLERFDVPHAQGSSHGGTRIIRKAYYEDARYVPLLHRAWDAWRALEAEVGERLLVATGGLHFGPPDDPGLLGVAAAVDAHDLPHERLGAAAIARSFPQFRPAPGDEGIVEHEAGVLFAERSVMALVEVAQRRGAEVFAREGVTRVERGGERVVVSTTRRDLSCRRVVLTLGAWAPEQTLVPPLPIALSATRQVQLWVRPADPDAFRPGRFPVFMHYGPELVYGLPEAWFPGLKLASHHLGATVSPDTVDRGVHPEDEAGLRRWLMRHLPDADGPVLGARVCTYTNSPDGHFALGLHPAAPEVVVGTGFSGHGFKLAPEVGEILADLALDGASARTAALSGLFDLERFSRSR